MRISKMTLKNIPMEVVDSISVAGVSSVVVFNDDVSVAVLKKEQTINMS